MRSSCTTTADQRFLFCSLFLCRLAIDWDWSTTTATSLCSTLRSIQTRRQRAHGLYRPRYTQFIPNSLTAAAAACFYFIAYSEYEFKVCFFIFFLFFRIFKKRDRITPICSLVATGDAAFVFHPYFLLCFLKRATEQKRNNLAKFKAVG